MGLVGEAIDWTRRQVVSRVPKADFDQRDPDYIRDQLPGTWLLASLYFRADVQGLDLGEPTRRNCEVGRAARSLARAWSSDGQELR